MYAAAQFPSPPSSQQPAGWHGVVLFSTPSPGASTTVTIDLQGLEPNTYHAVHIHEKQIVPGKNCYDIGGHWNPLKQEHGSLLVNSKKRHAGDLCNNVLSNRIGTVQIKYQDPTIDLWNHQLSPVGRSVVVHDGPDDLGLGGVFINADNGQISPPLVNGFRENSVSFYSYEDLPPRVLCSLLADNKQRQSSGGGGGVQQQPQQQRQRDAMLAKLLSESHTTGNAGGRMACAKVVAV